MDFSLNLNVNHTQTNDLVYALLAMVALTFMVWIQLYRSRVGYMKQQKIHPQAVATRSQSSAVLGAVAQASDNFQNLFELPVLFYAIVLLLLAQGRGDVVYVVLAWAFVAGRALHSFIHCGYNKVMHRFVAYLVSSAFMWAMWARFAYQTLTAGS